MNSFSKPQYVFSPLTDFHDVFPRWTVLSWLFHFDENSVIARSISPILLVFGGIIGRKFRSLQARVANPGSGEAELRREAFPPAGEPYCEQGDEHDSIDLRTRFEAGRTGRNRRPRRSCPPSGRHRLLARRSRTRPESIQTGVACARRVDQTVVILRSVRE